MISSKPVRACVVGAGAIGLSAAHELARRGADVTVIEAEALAAGSSGLSVGVVGTQQIDPLQIALRALTTRRLRALERDGLAFHRIGYARLGHDATAMAAFERSVAIQRELGIADARVLDRRALRALVPDLRCDDLAGALFGPSDGYVDGHLYCALLGELTQAAGGRVRTRARLLGAERTAVGHRLELRDGVVECDVVVNAAGPWAQGVARLLGDERLVVRPERHQAVVVGLPRPLPYRMPMVMDAVPGLGGSGLNFRHERPDQLIAEVHVAADAEPADPDAYARGADPEALERMAELLLERLPSFTEATLGRGWAGLYPCSTDALPYVGPAVHDPTVIVAGGAGGYGIQLSQALGVLAADWALEGGPVSLPEARALVPGREPIPQPTSGTRVLS